MADLSDSNAPLPDGRARPNRLPDPPAETEGILARLWSFRFTIGAIAVFLLLYMVTVRVLEDYLYEYFEGVVESALQVQDHNRSIVYQIQYNVAGYTRNSRWVSLGGVRVSPMVLAKDGVTLLYVAGRAPQPPPAPISLREVVAEAERLLPATYVLNVSLPHSSPLATTILIFYALVALQALWIRSVRTNRKQQQLLAHARAERDGTEARSRSIERELEGMRSQLSSIEPTEPEQLSEVNELREERKGLEARLAVLETRELELRESAARASELSQEISALEDLLEEASDDLAARDSEIGELQKNLRRAAKDAASGHGGKQRESEAIAKRFSTLYPNLEVDDRALQDIVALRDETMKLKCEEKLKRLNDEADNMSVRRKVGGLPPHLTIFEMGFAGKGRLYYTKGSTRRFRVLNVGAKNTQNAAIEYLRKL